MISSVPARLFKNVQIFHFVAIAPLGLAVAAGVTALLGIDRWPLALLSFAVAALVAVVVLADRRMVISSTRTQRAVMPTAQHNRDAMAEVLQPQVDTLNYLGSQLRGLRASTLLATQTRASMRESQNQILEALDSLRDEVMAVQSALSAVPEPQSTARTSAR